MKRTVKLLGIIFSAVIIVTSFSGCKQLDDARKARGFWGNEKHTEIIFHDRKYKLIKQNDFFNPQTEQKTYRVAAKEMPILVATKMGLIMHRSKNGELFMVNGGWYAREDTIEKYNDLIDNAKLDHLAYIKEYVAKNEWHTEFTLFSDYEAKLLTTAFETKQPASAVVDDYCLGMLNVYKCDETGMFSTYSYDVVFFEESKQLLIEFDGNYYKVSDDVFEEVKLMLIKYRTK